MLIFSPSLLLAFADALTGEFLFFPPSYFFLITTHFFSFYADAQEFHGLFLQNKSTEAIGFFLFSLNPLS